MTSCIGFLSLNCCLVNTYFAVLNNTMVQLEAWQQKTLKPEFQNAQVDENKNLENFEQIFSMKRFPVSTKHKVSKK